MPSPKLVFSSLVASLLLIGTGNLKANAQSAHDWVEQALGRYQSQIWGGDRLLPGTTEFRKTGSSSIEGRYTMNEQGKSVPGSLAQCQAIQVRVMRCVWNDKYGTGNLEVTFSEDFSIFNGYWGEGSSEPGFRWSGSR